MAVQLVDGAGFQIRHVRPGAGEGTSTTVLGRSYGFEWLPTSTHPASADLVEGSYTTRQGDAGEFELRFPNVAGSKGLWRDKFHASGCVEWVEIYRDGVLEFVGNIQRVEVDRGTVTVSGPDGFALLKRAYERDRSWDASPVDVIEGYTRVPQVALAERWANTSAWGVTTSGSVSSASKSVVNGRGRLSFTGLSSGGQASFGHTFAESLGDAWVARFRVWCGQSHTGNLGMNVVVAGAVSTVGVGYAMGPSWSTDLTGGLPANIPGIGDRFSGQEILIVRSGRWVSLWVDGRFQGQAETGGGTSTAIGIGVWSASGTFSGYVELGPVEVTALRPFLNRSSDRGTLRLPGDYPTGGLRGEYHNNADLQGFPSASRKAQLMSPARESKYGERVDPTIDFVGGTGIPMPGGPSSNEWFSVRWTGAVWLPNAPVEFAVDGLDDGMRLWVGDLRWDKPLLADWNDGGSRTVGTGGLGTFRPNLSGGAGWYPIRLDYYQGPRYYGIRLLCGNAPGWTDPSGTVMPGGTFTTVPETSLSPLGVHQARIQGQSHFQIVQDVAGQHGYELELEPRSLESGLFPMTVIPRHRVGRDTDVVLEVEDDDRNEPILSPGVTTDSSDQAVRFIGTGAGNADNRGGQTLAEVADPNADALFELQAYADAGDASLPQLLEARLNAELALRGTPWEEVRGNPRGLERLSDTWPLTRSLAAMRWRVGDGVRIHVPDVGIVDEAPRRLTQVTRGFMAEGRTSTSVGFRQRPRSAAAALRKLAVSQSLGQRSDQGRLVTIQGQYVSSDVPAGNWTDYGIASLIPGDVVRRAVLRIVLDTGTGEHGVEINSTNRTTELGGRWGNSLPIEIDITPYAIPAGGRLWARVSRAAGGGTGIIQWQMTVEVLRR